jgi:hypothetical protein
MHALMITEQPKLRAIQHKVVWESPSLSNKAPSFPPAAAATASHGTSCHARTAQIPIL